MLPLLDICSPRARAFEDYAERSSSLLVALSELSDAELAALEDDLDLYSFTGLRSKRIANLLSLCDA